MMAAWDMGALGRRMGALRGPVFMHLGGRDTTVPTSWSGRTYAAVAHARGITVSRNPMRYTVFVVEWAKQTTLA